MPCDLLRYAIEENQRVLHHNREFLHPHTGHGLVKESEKHDHVTVDKSDWEIAKREHEELKELKNGSK